MAGPLLFPTVNPLESLREEGVGRLDEVKVAYLVRDGKVSVIKHNKESESTMGNDKDLF